MLQVTWEHAETTGWLRLEGELALETMDKFETGTATVPKSGERIVVDCEELTFIDSTGTNALLQSLLRWRREGRVVELVKLREEIHEMFDLIGVFEVLQTPLHR